MNETKLIIGLGILQVTADRADPFPYSPRWPGARSRAEVRRLGFLAHRGLTAWRLRGRVQPPQVGDLSLVRALGRHVVDWCTQIPTWGGCHDHGDAMQYPPHARKAEPPYLGSTPGARPALEYGNGLLGQLLGESLVQ